MKSVGQLVQQMIRAEVEDLVDRVEPQRVDMVLSQPVQRVVDEEASNLGALRTIEIDRGTPWRAITVGKVGAILAQVVSFRAEMVVDDVQHHREPFAMTSVDQPLQPQRSAIYGMRRVKVGAVVPPVARAGKRRHRHELDRRDAQVAQVGKPANNTVESSLGREGSGVQLINYEIFQRAAFPIAVGPRESVGVNDLRSVMNSVRLKTRNRIGTPAVGSKLIVVVRPGAQTFGEYAEGAVGVLIHAQNRRMRIGDT